MNMDRVLMVAGGWLAMTVAMADWAKATEYRQRAEFAANAGEYQHSKALAEQAEEAANIRRSWLAMAVAVPFVVAVAGSVWWKWEDGVFVQFLAVLASTAFCGWVISRPETGKQADTFVMAVLLMINSVVAWYTAPEVVLVVALATVFGYVFAGAVWFASRDRPAPLTNTAGFSEIGSSGDVSAIINALADAIPSIGKKMEKETKEAFKVGRPPRPVIKPFIVSSDDSGTKTAVVRLPSPASIQAFNKTQTMPALASSLQVPSSHIVVREGADDGEIEMRLLPKPVQEMPLPAWEHWTRPIVNDERFVLGHDETGEPNLVNWSEANSMFIGGQKRSGKSNTLRAVTLALAAQSPWVRLHLVNGKGTGDFNVFEPIAHTHISGNKTAHIEKVLALLDWIEGEASRRADILSSNIEVFPEQKFTPDDLGTEWGVYADRVVIDEVDTLITAEPKIGEILAKLGRKLAAAQFGMTLATQSAIGDGMPNEIMGSCDLRVCHYVATYRERDAVLDDGWTGIQPQSFRHKSGDSKGDPIKGLAAVKGGSSDLVRVPIVSLDDPKLIGMVEELRLEREEFGALSGEAAGEILPERVKSLMETALELWPSDMFGEPCESVARAFLSGELEKLDGFENKSARAISRDLQKACGDVDKSFKAPPHDNPEGNRLASFRLSTFEDIVDSG